MSRAFDPLRGSVRFAALHTLSPAVLRAALDTIGGTPIAPLTIEGLPVDHEVFLKLEGSNLTGSIKDRTALALIGDLQRQGRIAAGTTIVESTSGNLGVALAMLARAYDLNFISVVDPNVSAENIAKIRAFGAEVEIVEEAGESGYLAARLARVHELCDSEPNYVWTDQYSADANPRAHQTGTAPELLRQLDGRLDMVFVAVSTCGTLAGIGAYLRRASPTTRIIAVDAQGSVIFGGPPSRRLLVGIGSGRTPTFSIDGLYDEVVHVTDGDAFACSRSLATATGIHVGGSSGAVIAACLEVLAQTSRPCRVACICPDNGDNYLSTIWSDSWLAANGLDASSVPGGIGFALPNHLTTMASAPSGRS